MTPIFSSPKPMLCFRAGQKRKRQEKVEHLDEIGKEETKNSQKVRD